jgi:hypothetical protein
MATISEILGTDDNWRSITYRAERITRGKWRCQLRDDRHSLLRQQVTGSKREARETLRGWGATKLDECPAL